MADVQLEDDLIKKLGSLLEKATKAAKVAETGACVYSAGEKTYCASLSKSDCDALSGTWTSGGTCP
jgi:hypothetical protein